MEDQMSTVRSMLDTLHIDLDKLDLMIAANSRDMEACLKMANLSGSEAEAAKITFEYLTYSAIAAVLGVCWVELRKGR